MVSTSVPREHPPSTKPLSKTQLNKAFFKLSQSLNTLGATLFTLEAEGKWSQEDRDAVYELLHDCDDAEALQADGRTIGLAAFHGVLRRAFSLSKGLELEKEDRKTLSRMCFVVNNAKAVFHPISDREHEGIGAEESQTGGEGDDKRENTSGGDADDENENTGEGDANDTGKGNSETTVDTSPGKGKRQPTPIPTPMLTRSAKTLTQEKVTLNNDTETEKKDRELNDYSGTVFDPEQHRRLKDGKCLPCKTHGCDCFIDKGYKGTKPRDRPFCRCTSCTDRKVSCRKDDEHGEPIPIPRADMMIVLDDNTIHPAPEASALRSKTPNKPNNPVATKGKGKANNASPAIVSASKDDDADQLVGKRKRAASLDDADEDRLVRDDTPPCTETITMDLAPAPSMPTPSSSNSKAFDLPPAPKKSRTRSVTFDPSVITHTLATPSTFSQLSMVNLFLSIITTKIEAFEHTHHSFYAQRTLTKLELQQATRSIIQNGKELLDGHPPSRINPAIHESFIRESSACMKTINSMDPSVVADMELPLDEVQGIIDNILKIIGSPVTSART